ncbi:MAG: hypothetical protein ACT6QS_15000 [Flavobacteriales bacterium]
MIRPIYILFLLLAGFFAAPALLSACEKKTETHACEREKAEKKDDHTAVKKTSCHKERKCCGSKSCHCISFSAAPGLVPSPDHSVRLPFATVTAHAFANISSPVSEGFYTLRLPPKIV